MTGKNDDKITDIVIPTLQKLQSGMAELQKDMGMVKEAIRRIDMRMGALEGHVSGIYSTSRYHSDELDDLRGRVETLEDNPPDKPPSDSRQYGKYFPGTICPSHSVLPKPSIS